MVLEAHFMDFQNYYIAILVERQVWFGDTVQISLVWESSELCLKNHAKIINSVVARMILGLNYIWYGILLNLLQTSFVSWFNWVMQILYIYLYISNKQFLFNTSIQT